MIGPPNCGATVAAREDGVAIPGGGCDNPLNCRSLGFVCGARMVLDKFGAADGSRLNSGKYCIARKYCSLVTLECECTPRSLG
jgi:hypothetical protein